MGGDAFYLVTSNGKILEFNEGMNDSFVKSNTYETYLSSKFDVEGLCHDPDSNSLLLACKGFPGDGFENMRSVYSFSLDSMMLNSRPKLLLSKKNIVADIPYSFSQKLGEFFLLVEPKSFAPSGLEIHPKSGTFFILSSRSRLVIEVSRTGELIGVIELSAKTHKQPEGITFLQNDTMVICDEGEEGRAKLTLYQLPDVTAQ